MKNAETVTDDKGNIYMIPGQMTREEAEVYFPNRPERSKREDLTTTNPLPKDLEKRMIAEWNKELLS